MFMARVRYNRKKRQRTTIFVVVLIAVIGLIWLYNSGGYGDLFSKSIIQDNYCEENIYLDNITIFQGQLYSGIDEEAMDRSGTMWEIDAVWKDGTSVAKNDAYGFYYVCNIGSGEGENVNYFYCRGLGYSKEVKEIDSSGNILGIDNRNYQVDLVIDMANPLDTRPLTRTNMWGSQKKVGDYTINKIVDSTCKRIE